LKTAKLLACCLLAFSLAGGARRRPSDATAQTPAPRTLPRGSVEALRSRIAQGGELFRAGRYTEAAHVFESVFHSAQSLSLPDIAGRALGNWGGCQYALHQYQAALGSFLKAHRLAESAGDRASEAVCDANIASLYTEMGEYDAAAQWIGRSLDRMPDAYRNKHLPQLQIQMATLRARQKRTDEAIALFKQGIDGADRAGDLTLYAMGWNRLGEAFLNQGDLPQAEAALLEGYRTRKLHHLAVDESYRSLGRLRLAQGDLTSASTLLDRAVEMAVQPEGLMPTWDIYHSRGRGRLAQGRWREALDDLRIALRLGRAWRWSAPADDAARVATEGMLDQVHSAFIEAGNRLYLETRDPALLRETFAAEEENRAASLRALLNEPKSAGPDLPGNYWELLDRLQRAEVAGLRNGGVADLDAARAELIRMEASLGPDLHPLPADLVEASRRTLEAGTALLSFHLGASISWVWGLDRGGLEAYPLPPRSTIESQVRAATAAIRDGRPDADDLAAVLYRMLFGPLAPRFQRAGHWLLALDDALFDAPVSALVETLQPRPVYVAERHTVELIPGVAAWLDSAARPEPRLSPVFLGVGDPIYNHADARLAAVSHHQKDALILPRLVGSGAEIDNCARAWEGPSVLLRGSDASREKLAEELQRHPAAVHLAVHFLESAARVHYGLIALSFSAGGDTELLTPAEISRWRIQTGLVVLSGCHSAAGAALPGTGAPGLTRAWLAAGAQSVVGSLWDTKDDDGALFSVLYRSLHAAGRLDAPRALREAQLAMIHSGGSQSRPGYWGAYFVVGNQGKSILPQ
jgi:CHAT domain-containing protein/tetratricopeptide (TPR) repeat protein